MYLINDILNFTQEDFDQEPRMVFEEINIREEILPIKSMFEMRASIRGIDLIYEIDEAIPDKFSTDSQRLR
jgi:signal transduction histidine kinase